VKSSSATLESRTRSIMVSFVVSAVVYAGRALSLPPVSR
jgi:hypothetical protein